MTDQDFSDTQKKDFFSECENFTTTEVIKLKIWAKIFRARRFFQSLKNRYLIG